MKQQKRQMPGPLLDRLATLSRVGTVLLRQMDEAAVLRLCAQTARDLTGATFAAVIVRPVTEEQKEGEPLATREGGRFQLAIVVGTTQEQEAFLHRVLRTGEELFASFFQQGRPLRVADVVPQFSPAQEPSSATGLHTNKQMALAQGSAEEDGPAKGLPAGHAGVRSLLDTPLLDGSGQVHGGVLLGHGESGHFRQEDELLLMNLTSQTALALERARLARLIELRDRQLSVVLERSANGVPLLDTPGSLVRERGLAPQVRERLQDTLEKEQAVAASLQDAEHEATERASQLEAIFEAVPEALLVSDHEGRLTRMNTAGQQLYEHLGLSESTAAPFANRAGQVTVWDEHGQPLGKESFPNARILAGEVLSPVQPMEISLLDRQGERVCLSITGGPLRDTQDSL